MLIRSKILYRKHTRTRMTNQYRSDIAKYLDKKIFGNIKRDFQESTDMIDIIYRVKFNSLF